MSQALSEHFVREAGEYLDELEQVLGATGEPDADRLFRLARGVRGSAELADAGPVCDVAARLERAASFVAEGRIPWSASLRERFGATLADLRVLVPRAAGGWDDEAERRADAAMARWGGFDGDSAADAYEIVPIEALFHDDDGPHVLGPAAEPADAAAGEDAVVSIDTLLLRGDHALDAALRLRSELERLIASRDGGAADAELRDRLVELWDLIQLGRSAGA